MPRLRLAVAFAAIYILWGSSYLAIRYGVETIPPFLMAGARFVIAGTIVFLVAWWREGIALSRTDWAGALVVGALLFAGGNGGLVWGEQTVPSGIAALLVATMAIWLVLIDWLRPHGRAPGAQTIAGLVLGLIGVGVLVGPDAFNGRGIDPIGASVILAAAVSWAAGTIYSKRVARPRSALSGTATQMLCGGVVLLAIAAFTGEPARFEIAEVSTLSALGFVYLVLLASVVAFTAYTWLVPRTTPAQLGTYAYVNPVIAVLLGWLYADEPFTPRTLIAAAIIVLAVALVTLSQRDGAPPSPPPSR